jgi:hypothetical protein
MQHTNYRANLWRIALETAIYSNPPICRLKRDGKVWVALNGPSLVIVLLFYKNVKRIICGRKISTGVLFATKLSRNLEISIRWSFSNGANYAHTISSLYIYIFIYLLYFFPNSLHVRATMCPSSGEFTVYMRHCYSSICMGGCLDGWLGCGCGLIPCNHIPTSRPDSHPYRVKNTSVAYIQ